MTGESVHRTPSRVLAAVIAVAGLALAAVSAGAAVPEGDTPGASIGRSEIERWKGRFCPPTGCAGSASSPWGAAAGFAAAVLASGWIARRPNSRF